jgi:hypothetical protein
VLALDYVIEELIITDIPEINSGKAQTCTIAFWRNLGLLVIDDGDPQCLQTVESELSFPIIIISERIDGAIRPRSEWR